MFENVNKELANVTDWCFANKLSVNRSKAKYIFSHKQAGWNIPLNILKGVTELKFLGVMIEKNLNWQSHIKLVESKISKTLESYLHLNKKWLLMIDIFLIFTFIYKLW